VSEEAKSVRRGKYCQKRQIQSEEANSASTFAIRYEKAVLRANVGNSVILDLLHSSKSSC
jgi:hypothetical protein